MCGRLPDRVKVAHCNARKGTTMMAPGQSIGLEAGGQETRHGAAKGQQQHTAKTQDQDSMDSPWKCPS